MTTYGIFVVPPDWHEGKTATMDKTTFQYHGEELQPGTRLLLYMKEPVDAIVGEAEVTGMIVPPDPMAQSDADASTHHALQHSHRAFPAIYSEGSARQRAQEKMEKNRNRCPWRARLHYGGMEPPAIAGATTSGLSRLRL